MSKFFQIRITIEQKKKHSTPFEFAGDHIKNLVMEETRQTLIASLPEAPRKPKSKVARVMRKTFKGTAHLSNLLPTGSVMGFQIMCPVLTHQGQCPTITSRWLTCFLVFVCAVSCFLLSFTDSFRDQCGKVYRYLIRHYACMTYRSSQVHQIVGINIKLDFAGQVRIGDAEWVMCDGWNHYSNGAGEGKV